MGKAYISCCEKYTHYDTSGGDRGAWSCPNCGCLFKWGDYGGGDVRVWREEACDFHQKFLKEKKQ